MTGSAADVALVEPHPRFHRSFLEAVEEYAAAGELRQAGLPSWPAEGRFRGIELTQASVRTETGFAELVEFLLEQRRPDAPRPRTQVPFTQLWITEDDRFLGSISLRHELNQVLLEWGGHVGYSVRPSARRRGVASAALAQLLPLARRRGMTELLVTCDVDNVGSRRTIERAGGVYEDTRDVKLRYWIDL